MEDFFKVALYLYAYDRMSRPLREASRSLDFTRRAVERLTRAAERLKAVGERISLAGALVSGASAQATGALRSMVKPLFELDARLKAVAVEYRSAGLSAQEMSRYLEESRRAAIAWSKAHTQTAADFAWAEYMMLSAGLKHRAALEGTRAALAMATATMGEASEAANLLATVYNNLGNHLRPVRQEMWRLADILTKTQQAFQIKDLNQLTESFRYGASAAKQYRVSLEQTAVTLGMLNTAGLQGSMAGTAFAAMLRNLYRASDKLGFAIARPRAGSRDL
ncbi:MAG: phage tail tape measure protein, partial [Thermodesulfatator sp.]